MAYRRIKDASVTIGKYEVNGESKNRYLNVGVMLKGDDGNVFLVMYPWVNLAALPHKEGKGVIINLYDIRDSDAQGADSGSRPPARDPAANSAPPRTPPPNNDLDDDIPF